MTWFEIFWDSLERPIRLGNQVFAFSWLSIIAEWLLPVIVLLFVFLFINKRIARGLKASGLSEERKPKLIRAVKILFRVTWVLILVVLSARFLESSILGFFTNAYEIISSPFYKSADTQISVFTLLLMIPVFYGAYLLSKASKLAIDRSKYFAVNLGEARKGTISNLVRYAVLVISVLVGLSVLGVNLSSISLILFALLAALCLGMLQVLVSFFAGLVLVLNRPFREGDYISLILAGKQIEGTVLQVRMIHTLVQKSESETVVVPNYQLLHQAVNNASVNQGKAGLSLSILIEHESNIATVRQVLSALVGDCPFWNKKDEATVQVGDIRPEGIRIDLFLHLEAASDHRKARAWLNEEILSSFSKKAIRLAK